MKNILFYYDNFCSDTSKGGTEVATFRIAKALKETGKVNIFHAFRSKSDGSDKSIYKDVIKLSKSDKSLVKDLKAFLNANGIDVVVNMGRFFRHKHIKKAAEYIGRDIQLIFMQHFAPGSELKKGTYKSGWHLLKLNPYNPIYWLRASLYPILKLNRTISYPKAYKYVYDTSHKIVLLSSGYKEEYQRIGRFEDDRKFVAIPNIYEDLSLKNKNQEKTDINEDNFTDASIAEKLLKKKKRHVLILSRLDEIQKRISVALRIWSLINRYPELSNWHLDIVGSGHNSDIAHRLAKKFGLKNITFHGWQNGVKFLMEDSILISTSDYEGLPLSLIEAQVYGCVPIAFNSYASLKDVVTDGKNGIIVNPESGVDGFAQQLSALMKDNKLRHQLALNAMNNTNKFSSNNIAQKWLEILT